MAGTVTQTHQKHRTVKKIKFDWLSDASGDATVTTEHVSGQILRVCFAPDGGGTQPTNLYDVVLNDDEGQDVLMGLGANLANDADTNVVPVVTDGTAGNMAPVAIDDTLDLAVSNAGNAKGGEITIWYR